MKVFIDDNLEVLRKMESESVDFIYTDPPYNTKHPLSYMDNNNDWNLFIKERLELARNVMKKGAVICVSIDDNELVSLLNICQDVFGKKNYLGTFITRQSQRSCAKFINIIHEYVVVFAKNKKYTEPFYIKRMEIPEDRKMIQDIISKVQGSKKVLEQLIRKYATERDIKWILNYSNIDEQGRVFSAKDLTTPGEPAFLDLSEIGINLKSLKRRRYVSKDLILDLWKKGKILNRSGRLYEKLYLTESVDNIPSLLNFWSRQGTNDLKKLGLEDIFDTPKPVALVKYLIRAVCHKDSVILDFFAGSGTTAQAIQEINKEDNMHHECILIQNNEKMNPKTKAYQKMVKLGYKDPKISDVLLLRLDKLKSL